MLRDDAKKYYLEDEKNCAESVYKAACEAYGVEAEAGEEAIIRAFGGGMGCGRTCGALCGALAGLGRLYDGSKTDKSLKDHAAMMVAEFEAHCGGSSRCPDLKERYKTPELRCFETVARGCDVLEAHLSAMGIEKNHGKEAVTVTPEDIKRVKGLGFLHNKGTNSFNCRVITRNGKVTAAENACIAEAARRFGSGEVALTTRLTMEIIGVPFDNIDAIRAFLGKEGLETGGTGSKVRPVVSCKGTTCQYGLIDTFDLSQKIHEAFYKGYADVKLPHKFKIAVGGCPNNCVKPNLNDIGIVGQRVPVVDLDKCRGCGKCAVEAACPIKVATVKDGKITMPEDACNHCGRCIGKCYFDAVAQGRVGYQIVIGGRWGKRYAIGQPLRHLFTQESEVLKAVEKAILFFREQGQTGERFSDTVARVGFDVAEAEICGDAILARKEAILGSSLHMVGGATC